MQLLSYRPGNATAASPATDEDLFNIDLTDEEVAEALRKVKIEKYYERKEQEARRRRDEFVRELQRPWTPQEQMNYLEVRARELGMAELHVDVDNQFVLEALCRYFTNDLSFVSMGAQVGEKWSLNKGILMQGNVGCGKTTIMKLFARNKRRCYDYLQCTNVADLFERDGAEALEILSHNRQDVRGAQNFYQETIGRCYDDLGVEDIKQHYGNKKNVMAEILFNRYHYGQRVPKDSTHLTTNLTLEEIEARYGSRVYDRLREMFNIVVLPGGSRRQ